MKRTQLRKGLTLTAVAALALGLGACGRGGDDSGTKTQSSGGKGSGDKVVMLVSTLNNPFFVDLRDGAQAEAKKRGMNLEISDAQDDSTTQANQAQNAQSQGTKVVIVNPVDSDAIGPSVGTLNSAKIPVIAVDRGVNGADVDSFIASDNVAGGEQAGKALAKAIGEKGNVLHIQGIPGSSSSRDRGEGFDKALAQFPNIKVVGKQTANFDRTEGLDVTTNLMQANSDVKAVFAENDEMALGAIQALGNKAGKDVLVFSFDGTADGLKAVSDGKLTATVAQQPKELGKKAVQIAADILAGKAPKKTADVPVILVDKDNVADYS